MERIRSPHASSADASEEKAAPVALSVLLERVKSPGVERKDVDALLAGIATPLAEDESPRARADLLLSLLNSPHLCSMQGREGRSVETAAVQAVMELGQPYTLEIPPEALGALNRDSHASSEMGQRRLPVVGIIVALVTFIPGMMDPMGIWLAVPALAALLGGALELRGLQKAGVALMALLSLGLIIPGGWLFYDDARSSSDNFDGLGKYLGMIGIALGVFLGLGAFLLRHPAWRIEDKAGTRGRRYGLRRHRS